MYKNNAKQEPNNIFPIFGSVKTGAKKLIAEKQKITDCHEIFDGRASIRRNQRSGGVWQFHMWIRAENKQYRKSLRTSHFETDCLEPKEGCFRHNLFRICSDSSIS
tara:strand:- start:80 stop:397 length:318 start_codon:yes stop_codon:yes gene_type:complete